MNRRRFLQALGASAIALPFYELLHMSPQAARAASGMARRSIFFYFPDGVPGASQDGDASLWHCRGSEYDFQLSECLQPLGRFKDECVFINGLTMGGTDSGSHPGGAKKLLTAVDGGGGESIDHFLSRTAGSQDPWRLLLLGAMSNHNGASGDKHVSYSGPGQTMAPEDSPMRAFERLFGRAPDPGGNNDQPDPNASPSLKASVIDGVLADMHDLKARLGNVERSKLDQHLESLREVELRIKADTRDNPMPRPQGCDDWRQDPGGLQEGVLHDPGRFGDVLRLQIDLMVQAMACGITRVGTLQASHHTSELIMSRIPDSEMHDPGFDMRSHQASHYGSRHDRGKREFTDFVLQRRWFVEQFTYLLESLASRPEGDGTMLDHTLVWLCTEVSDGNTHSHDDMPFVLAGRGGGCLRTGRLLQYNYHPHSDLMVAIAQAMGQNIQNFGWHSSGPLPGLLG